MCSLLADSLEDRLPFRPLLITPKPHQGESYEGYILRVSDANGYHNPAWMLRQLGVRSGRQIYNSELNKLAAAFRLPETELRSLLGFPVQGQARWLHLMGHDIHHCTFEKRHNRICPQCLKEHGWMKSVWELKPYICCPEHGVYLVDQCPDCSKPIAWNRETLTECKCGKHLGEIKQKRASEQAIRLCRQIEKVFLGGSASDLPEPFASLDLTELLNHLLFLATYYSGRGKGTGRRLMYRVSNTASIEVFERIAAALFDWPNSFYNLLDDIRQHSTQRINKTGLEAEFQTFYLGLFGQRKEAQGLQIIKSAFSDYIRTYWDGGAVTSKNTRLGLSSESPELYISLAEAARSIDLHPSILRKDIERGRLKSVDRNMQERTLRMICRDDLERYRSERKKLIDKPTVMKRFGLSKAPFMKLVNDGVIKAVRGPTIDGSSLWFFDSKQIDNLYLSLLSIPVKRAKKIEDIAFKAAVRKVTARGLGISDLVQVMLAGLLKASYRVKGETGLFALCFDQEVLNEFLLKSKSSVEWGVSIERAARKLSLNEEATRDLVRKGLLKTTWHQEAGRLNCLVSFDAIERFKKIYVSAAEVAIRLKTSPKAVVLLLQDRHISPITGPCVDGNRQYFYARNQVLSYLKENTKLQKEE